MEQNRRNSSIELLRILLVIGVFLHHLQTSSNGLMSYVIEGSFNHYFFLIIESVDICSVNTFILISAYYLSQNNKRNYSKIVFLITEIIIINVLYYLCFAINNNVFIFSDFILYLIPRNYYVILYSVLYIISPYINVLLDSLDKRKTKKMLIIFIVIFSFISYFVDIVEFVFNIPLDGLSPIGLYGSQEGYTIVNFVLLYFIGAYIRRKDTILSIKKSTLYYGLCVLGLFVFSLLSIKIVKIPVWNYNNPLIIMSSVYLLYIFLNIKLDSKFINHISRAVYSFFLIHVLVFPYIQIESLANSPIIIVLIKEILILLVLYFVSFIFDLIYRSLFNHVIKINNRK